MPLKTLNDLQNSTAKRKNGPLIRYTFMYTACLQDFIKLSQHSLHQLVRSTTIDRHGVGEQDEE